MEKFPQSNKPDSQERWKQEKEAVDKLTDRLGLEIDEGIKDTVIALRLLGLNTTASHEGKIHRYPIPYVDMASEEAVRLSNQRDKFIDSLKSPEEKSLDEEIDGLYDQLDHLDDEDPEALEVRDKIEALELKYQDFNFPESEELDNLAKKIKAEVLEIDTHVKDLLNEFYSNRNVSEEVKLETRFAVLGSVRLLSHGWKLQENEEDGKRREKRLRAFQAEMKDFTDFLKSKL